MTADVKIDRESVEELARRLRIYIPWDCPPASEAKRTLLALLDAKEAAEAECDLAKAQTREAQAEQVAVVKPLEWRASGAETTFGNYIVTCEEHDDRLVWFILFGGKVRYSLGEYVTEEAAKTAAQADYERRLLSALTIRADLHADTQAKLEEQIEWVKGLSDDLIASEGREARLKDKLDKAMDALRFYADKSNYEGQYVADNCGCCGSWYEPKIHKDGEDDGDLARRTIAELEWK